MPITTNSLQLFGLDLGQLWQELRQALRGIQQSPALAWLTPDFLVRVLAELTVRKGHSGVAMSR